MPDPITCLGDTVDVQHGESLRGLRPGRVRRNEEGVQPRPDKAHRLAAGTRIWPERQRGRYAQSRSRHRTQDHGGSTMYLDSPPALIETRVFTTMPKEFRRTGEATAWADANKSGHPVDCFIEGPAF